MEDKRVISKKKTYIFCTVTVLLFFVICAAAYVCYVAFRTADIYQYVKANKRGWKGNVHAAHTELGFAPVPNSVGAHVLPVGPDIPMQYDAEGFRAPMKVGRTSKSPRPLILAFGGSFTYGDAIDAKDTYVYLVGQSLEGSRKNAGVCSYGLSQMLLLARKLVPIHKPDYVLLQYSPWLADRARRQLGESYFGKLPTPFFYEQGNGFALSPPLFLTKTMDLPVSRYRNTPNSWIDAFSFYWKVGLPLLVHDDFHILKCRISASMGMIPKPTSARDRLIKYVYKEINSVAEECGAQVVIVVLGRNVNQVKVSERWFPSNALIVNAHDALLRRLPIANMAHYRMNYANWRGFPPVIVDKHPNETAHKIIADAIVSEIRRFEVQWPNKTLHRTIVPHTAQSDR